MTPTQVFVVAASPLIRAGLRSMLAGVEGTEVWVVGEAGSLADPNLAPSEADVVLLADEDLLEEAVQADDGVQAVLVLSEDEGLVSRLRALPGDPQGWGVVLPDASPEELGAAVAAVGQGLVVLPRPLGERLLREPATVEELPEPPTARELEVLELLGRGRSNKLIARELHISEHTVKFHVSSLYAKLGVNNRAEAVGRGARYGLVSL